MELQHEHRNLPKATWTDTTGTDDERKKFAEDRWRIMLLLKTEIRAGQTIIQNGKDQFFPNGGESKQRVIDAERNFTYMIISAKETIIDIGEEVLNHANTDSLREKNDSIIFSACLFASDK